MNESNFSLRSSNWRTFCHLLRFRLESWIFRNDSNLRFYQTVTHDMIFIVLWKRNWSSSFETFLPIEINWSIRKIPFLFLIHIFGAFERNFFLLPLGNFISFLICWKNPNSWIFVNETRVFLLLWLTSNDWP